MDSIERIGKYENTDYITYAMLYNPDKKDNMTGGTGSYNVILERLGWPVPDKIKYAQYIQDYLLDS